ncbi:MAG: hypothetical protein ACK5RO_04585, partial [Pseudobdellovibrionaceae bacterium]
DPEVTVMVLVPLLYDPPDIATATSSPDALVPRTEFVGREVDKLNKFVILPAENQVSELAVPA